MNDANRNQYSDKGSSYFVRKRDTHGRTLEHFNVSSSKKEAGLSGLKDDEDLNCQLFEKKWEERAECHKAMLKLKGVIELILYQHKIRREREEREGNSHNIGNEKALTTYADESSSEEEEVNESDLECSSSEEEEIGESESESQEG